MDAVYVKDIGFIIAVIDSQSIRFLKLGIGKEGWSTIAMIEYTNSEWILQNEVPEFVALSKNGKHSVSTTDASSLVIHKLMT